MRVRRLHSQFLCLGGDPPAARVPVNLRTAVTCSDSVVLAYNLQRSSCTEISRAQLDLLLWLSAYRWTHVDELDFRAEAIQDLVDLGLVLVEEREQGGGPPAVDQRMLATGWSPEAALVHFLSRRADLYVGGDPPSGGSQSDRAAMTVGFRDRVAALGPPPPPVEPRADRSETLSLPEPGDVGQLSRLLRGRCTTRAFDDRPLSSGDLGTLLHHVYHFTASWDMGQDVIGVRRTSPSGGAWHPIDVYLLVQNVAGIPLGIHHYDCGQHQLELLQEMEAEQARDQALAWMGGQGYAAGAAVLCALVARFDRSYWKYRSNADAYRVILMDSGHLSQTFYLVCGALGLGAFVSAALNARTIEHDLGLDGVSTGVIAVNGCGYPDPNGRTDAEWQEWNRDDYQPVE